MKRFKLGELENMSEKGGLGLPNLSVKADAFLMKRLCSMLSLPNENSYRLVGYWLGSFLQDTGLGEDFPRLAEVGPLAFNVQNLPSPPGHVGHFPGVRGQGRD